jgi:hypothetical protein
MKALITKTAQLKSNIAPISMLNDWQKHTIAIGTELDITGHRISLDGEHVLIELKDALNSRNSWFIELNSVEIEDFSEARESDEEVVFSVSAARKIFIPGEGKIEISAPILGEGCHFNWGELTKNGNRLPTDEKTVGNIKKLIEALEDVREFFGGNPITVTSGYRPPAVNRRVGGASHSRHVVGDAADFIIQGVSPAKVNRELNDWWGSRGGLGSSSVFTHLDCRGYRARWMYGR